MRLGSASAATSRATAVVEALADTRERTLALVATVSGEDLERVHSKLMSPLVWDLGHIAAFEDLWLMHRFGKRPLPRDDLADIPVQEWAAHCVTYDKGWPPGLESLVRQQRH